MEKIIRLKGRTGRDSYLVDLKFAEEHNIKSKQDLELFLWGKDTTKLIKDDRREESI